MAFETRKATRRRAREDADCIFPWSEILRGKILDVGAGNDPLQGDDVTTFDAPDSSDASSGRVISDVTGDANRLSSYFEPESFDVVAGSQVLEHMRDPAAALRDWLTLVKPGGYVVQTVPLWELYEYMRWPSVTNPDHRSTWSFWQKGSPAPIHCKLPEWTHQFGCDVLACRVIDTNYDYHLGMLKVDQTWEESRGVECWGEFVMQKPK